jgi:hypothetical protein
VVNQLKGFTSRTLRQRRRWLRSRLPKLWTRSYYIGSVGAVSSDTVSNFIPQRSERKGISMMVSLWSECRESKVRYPVPWGGKEATPPESRACPEVLIPFIANQKNV